MLNACNRLRAFLHHLFAAGLAWLASFTTALAGSPTLVAQPGVTAPASIPELARALKHDVNLIYEYVYTNIEYSPTYGLKKGALGTLLDGNGNDFDQSALLVALLRTSGYTATYKHGNLRLFPSDISAFFGVSTANACPLSDLLNNGAIPHTIYIDGPLVCTSTLLAVDFAHTWVSVTGGSLGPATAILDPSFKTYSTKSGISLSTATGYDQSAFLSAAKSGASITPNSLQNLNGTNIGSLLTSYAGNLVEYIRTYDPDNPAPTTRDIIGGNYIQPLQQPYALPTTLAHQKPDDNVSTWPGEVPDEYRTTLRIQIGGIDQVFFADDIYGHRLSIVYNNSVPPQPVLYRDGVALGTGAGNANTISYTVDFPFCYERAGAPDTGCPGGAGWTSLFTFQTVIQATTSYTYAIVAGWDVTGRGMVEFHRRQLQANRAAGNAESSEPVLGEALNMIGYSWLAQVFASYSVADRLIGSKVVVHCAVGVAAQVSGPYIDVPGVFGGTTSLSTDPNRAETALFSLGGVSSALEWGTLAQNLAREGVGAVSTIKLLDMANAQGDVIFDATSGNWPTVSPQLVGYSPSDFNQITAYIIAGYRLVLPRTGNLTQGAWSGAGYIGIGPGGGARRTITYKISSNLKGGYSSRSVLASTVSTLVGFVGSVVDPIAQFLGFDPVDLSSGAFLYDRDDLTTGSGEFPISLGFRRSYSSNNLYTKGPLGPGWSHNLSITAIANSDGLKGLGQDSPVDGAAAIASMHVAQDLLSDAAKPFDKVLVASLVQKWLMDRLITNTVNVTAGSQAEQFVLLADGSYNPQPGSTSRLTLSDGAYVLRYKDATALYFDAAGNIATWVVPSGVTTSFTYDASSPPLLTSVSNGLGRTLALSYNGARQLTAVSDNTGRSVSYSYDGSGNLALLGDVLGFTTTFGYTPAGEQAPAGLLSQIFYPTRPGTAFVTNIYDSLGRVAMQTNANGATWSYFFAGYRSEEDDPYGTQRVLYYNPRGKAQFDIQDNAGLNLVTQFRYDGLDRLVTTTLPEGYEATPAGDFTLYAYDNIVNRWANNIASVTRTGKGGSATITTYSNDATFNKPIQITGPPTAFNPTGLTTTMAYDPANGNVASRVADSTGIKARTSYTYTGLGLIASMTDPVGTITRYTYDGTGNRLSMVEDAGLGRLNRTTLYGYNSRGDATSVTDPNGNVTTSVYDDARRLVIATSPGTSAAPGGMTTTNSYDADNRLLQVQQTSGGSVLRTTSSTWTPTGKLATATDANGNVTRYEYDLLDRQSAVTDAMGRVTRFTFDALSRPCQTFNPAIQATPMLQQSYTRDGKLKDLTDANNNTTTFTYDIFNRLVGTTWPGGSTETSSYDNADNVLSRKTRADVMISFTYDTSYRLATKTPSVGRVVSYSYDLAGRPTAVADNSPAIVAAVSPTGSTVTYATTYSYDAVNRPTQVSWDPAPAVTPPAAGPRVTFGHSYDKTNRRIGQTADDNAWLAYPPATNQTTAYTSNNLNQYTAVTGLTPSYDGNGNLIGDGSFTYGYDTENRLVSIGGGATATFAYDAQGRRKMRAVTGSVPTISVTDADNREVLEYDATSGAVLRWYAYGLGPNDVLSQMDVPASRRDALVPDLQGSIIGSFDWAGTLTRYTYDPYGKGAAPTWGYTGQRLDLASAGLYFYRARHYSPGLGRFVQVDPVGYSAGSHLYAYVGNDPLNAFDPLGLDTQWTVGLGATAALQPLGLSGSFSVGLNIPSNPYDWRGYQIILGQGQANAMGGVGGFLGYGVQFGYSSSSGSIPWISGSTSQYIEVDIGAGPAVSVGMQAPSFPGSLSGGSVGLPVPRPGYGAGAFIGFGGSASFTLATPTFGSIYDNASSVFSSRFRGK